MSHNVDYIDSNFMTEIVTYIMICKSWCTSFGSTGGDPGAVDVEIAVATILAGQSLLPTC